jgi:choline dehydrogenase
MTQADYVVVGAGSAGCIVARRLAETGASVVLLEAGPVDKSRLVRQPGMIALVHSVPSVKKRLDWGYHTIPQKHAANREIPSTRGKIVGGSSSINGMLFVRGNQKNYDDWAAEGCTGWGFEDVLPAYKRMENWEDGPDDLRGSGGPIQVTRPTNITKASLDFIEALSDTAGVPKIDDYNGKSQEGASIFQQSAHKGLRYSASVGYLDNHHLPNLTVETGATISRVVLDGNRAVGVEVLDKVGLRLIRANKEIVLSAGVFGSPQILMLSGIGPAHHLREHGIDVRADLPVGQNLHDHLFVPMTFIMKSAVHRGTAPYFFSGIVKEALRGGTWMGSTVFEAAGFVKSSQATDIPDMQIHVLPWAYPSPNQDAAVRHKVDKRSALTVMPTLIYPKSRGTVRLASTDPTAAPLIDPAYLEEPADADLLIEGQQLIRETMANRQISSGVEMELHPGRALDDEASLRRELPNRVHTVYHPVGTCRMGVDERAVVDPQLRVLGIEGLRVADASIMPSVTGGNTNAPSMLIGERCADLMLA